MLALQVQVDILCLHNVQLYQLPESMRIIRTIVKEKWKHPKSKGLRLPTSRIVIDCMTKKLYEALVCIKHKHSTLNH